MKLSFRGNTAVALLLCVSAARAPMGAWEHRTDMPTARSGAAVFAVGSRLFVVGGQNQARFISATESFDTATGRWTRHAPIRLGRTFTSSNDAVVNGVLHVIGGNPRGYCTNAADAFDAATGRWRLLRGAPVPRCHAAAIAVDERVMLFGGWNTSSTVRYMQVDAFDARSNQWTKETTLPRPRGAMTAALVGRRVILAGGWTPDAAVSASVDVYDLETHRWSTAAPMHLARSGAAVAVVRGRMYVIGGITPRAGGIAYTAAVESYDPATDRWRDEPPLPVPVAYAAAASIGNTIYLVGGGREDGSIVSSVLTFTP